MSVDLSDLLENNSRALPGDHKRARQRKRTNSIKAIAELIPDKTTLVCPTSARKGDPIAVNWSVGDQEEFSSYSWIGLFKQAQPNNRRYISYQYTDGTRLGTLHFSAPAAGSYEFRFFPNNSYEYTAKSNLLIVGTQVHLIAVALDDYASFEVTIRVLTGELNKNDWVGLYRSETYHNKDYITRKYLSENKQQTLSFQVPRPPGQYEFRYFPSTSSYNDTSRSNWIEIENRDMLFTLTTQVSCGSRQTITANWEIYSVDPSTWDWVGLYDVKATGIKSYVEYHYVDKAVSTCEFQIPSKPGQYELRYISYSSGEQVARSTPISVVLEQPNNNSSLF